MSKRVFLNDDELYIIRAFVQDELNKSLLSSQWVYSYYTKLQLKKLMKKLEETDATS